MPWQPNDAERDPVVVQSLARWFCESNRLVLLFRGGFLTPARFRDEIERAVFGVSEILPPEQQVAFADQCTTLIREGVANMKRKIPWGSN